jgi:hypothetical protein
MNSLTFSLAAVLMCKKFQWSPLPRRSWPPEVIINETKSAPWPNFGLTWFLKLVFYRKLDGRLQKSLHEFLEAKGINDKLAVFLHKYMKNNDKTEFHSCVKSFIEKQVKWLLCLILDEVWLDYMCKSISLQLVKMITIRLLINTANGWKRHFNCTSLIINRN